MKRFGKYSTWVAAFIFLAALIILYRTFESFDSIRGFFAKLVSVLQPFVVGFAIAYLLRIPCHKLQALLLNGKNAFLKRHRKPVSVAAVYLLSIAAFAVILSFLLPALTKNLIELWNSLPSYFDAAVTYLEKLQADGILTSIKIDEITFDKTIEKIFGSVDANLIGKYAQGFLGITSNLINVFIAIVVSIYMLLDSENVKQAAKRITSAFVSPKVADGIGHYTARINDIFSKFIASQFIDAVIVATLMTVILLVLRVKYALVLGIMIGFFNLIPYFGAIIACVIACIITVFTGGPVKAIWVAVSLIVMQQIDGNIIGPKIMGSSLDIKPLWIIFAVTLGGGFFGVIGMIVSVPVFAVLKTMFWDYMEYREAKQRESQQT